MPRARPGTAQAQGLWRFADAPGESLPGEAPSEPRSSRMVEHRQSARGTSSRLQALASQRSTHKAPRKQPGCGAIPTQPVSRFAPLEAFASHTTSRLWVHSIRAAFHYASLTEDLQGASPCTEAQASCPGGILKIARTMADLDEAGRAPAQARERGDRVSQPGQSTAGVSARRADSDFEQMCLDR